MSADLWVLAEHHEGRVPESTLEALGAACRLAATGAPGSRVIALALGPESRATVAALARHGAEIVRPADDPRLDAATAPELCAAVLAAAHATEACPPAGFLFPATPRSRELGTRVAARRRLPFVADVLALGWRSGQIEARRLAYDDRVELTVVGGRVVVLGPSAGEIRSFVREALVVPLPVDLGGAGARVRIVRRFRADPRTVPLGQADFIVAGGNGLRNFGLLWQFADLVGAAVGGSRVVCDDGRLDPSRQIGESGVTVAPRCYMAFGISGASQHLGGMRGAQLVITVNTDRHAPIQDLAALAVIADAAEVLRACITALTTGDAGSPPAAAPPTALAPRPTLASPAAGASLPATRPT